LRTCACENARLAVPQWRRRGVSRCSVRTGQSEKHGASELATFECADFLEAPLHAVRVLMLTSKCWDASLLERVDRKLEEELPLGALLVDYSPRLRSSEQFVLLETRDITCSWGTETMAVFRREDPSHLRDGACTPDGG
jgi:hypothetical protein